MDRLLSKQVNPNVAKKKTSTRNPSEGDSMTCRTWPNRVRWTGGDPPGFQLSGNRTTAAAKFTAQMPAASHPGPVLPNIHCPPIATIGPMMKPSPNAIPIRPIRFALSSGGVISAM